MVNYLLLGILISLFIGILLVFSREHLDYVAISLLFALIGCVATAIILPIDVAIDYIDWINESNIQEISWFQIFISSIEFRPLLFIMGMQIIVVISEKHKIFQWIAVKALHFTKGNHRKFFYMICTIATLIAALIADVTVAVIFIPLVIRACKILEIDPSPYLYGITITIKDRKSVV